MIYVLGNNADLNTVNIFAKSTGAPIASFAVQLSGLGFSSLAVDDTRVYLVDFSPSSGITVYNKSTGEFIEILTVNIDNPGALLGVEVEGDRLHVLVLENGMFLYTYNKSTSEFIEKTEYPWTGSNDIAIDTSNIYILYNDANQIRTYDRTITLSFWFRHSGSSVFNHYTIYPDRDPAATLNIETATYDNKSLDGTSQVDVPTGISFHNDGTRAYVLDRTSGRIIQYDLSTAWDISTASYTRHSSILQSNMYDLFFSPDGQRLIVIALAPTRAYQYSLSTAWDISTLSFVRSRDITEESAHRAVFASSDGLNLFVVGTTNDTVYQYSLSTAWDISTASYTGNSFSVASQEPSPRAMFFSPDGIHLFIAGTTNDTVYQYSLSTAWDISTASYTGNSFSVASQEPSPLGLFLAPDGSQMYVIGNTNDTVYQYSLATPTPVTAETARTFIDNMPSSTDFNFSAAGVIDDYRVYDRNITADERSRLARNVIITVMKELADSYNIKNFIRKNLPDSFDIRNFVRKNLLDVYAINELISMIFFHDRYDVKNFISRQFPDSYGINGLASKLFADSYNIKNFISRRFTDRYDIDGLISKILSDSYNIKNFVRKQFMEVYGINELLSIVLLSDRYNINKFVSRQLIDTYNIVTGLFSTYFRDEENVNALEGVKAMTISNTGVVYIARLSGIVTRLYEGDTEFSFFSNTELESMCADGEYVYWIRSGFMFSRHVATGNVNFIGSVNLGFVPIAMICSNNVVQCFSADGQSRADVTIDTSGLAPRVSSAQVVSTSYPVSTIRSAAHDGTYLYFAHDAGITRIDGTTNGTLVNDSVDIGAIAYHDGRLYYANVSGTRSRSRVSESISKFATGRYNIMQFIRNQLEDNYLINRFISKSAAGQYSIKNFVRKNFLDQYAINELITMIFLRDQYNIRNFARKTYTDTYNIRNFARKLFTGTYTVNNFIRKLFDDSYTVYNFAKKILLDQYAINELISMVFLQDRYNIRNFVGRQFRDRYDIRNFVRKILADMYSVGVVRASLFFFSAISVLNLTRDYRGLSASGDYVYYAFASGNNTEIRRVATNGLSESAVTTINGNVQAISVIGTQLFYFIGRDMFIWDISASQNRYSGYSAPFDVMALSRTNSSALIAYSDSTEAVQINLDTAGTVTGSVTIQSLYRTNNLRTATRDSGGYDYFGADTFVRLAGGSTRIIDLPGLLACDMHNNILYYAIASGIRRRVRRVSTIRTQLSDTYTINDFVSKMITGTYSVYNFVRKSFIDIYGINELVAMVFFRDQYDIKNFIGRQFLDRYNIRSFIRLPLTDIYDIRNFVSKIFNDMYRIGNEVAIQLLDTYQINVFATKALVDRYGIRGTVQAILADTYTVNNFAIKTFRDSYRIINVAIKQLVDTYNIRNFARKRFLDQYAINEIVAMVFLRDRYNINDFVQKSITDTYTVKNFATKLFNGVYTVNNFAKKSITDTYTIAGRVIKQFADTYLINRFVRKNLVDVYAINELISMIFLHDRYEIRNFATKTFSGTYTVNNFARKLFDGRYEIRQNIRKFLDDTYLVSGISTATAFNVSTKIRKIFNV